MSLELVTAGESHGPALVAILTGLPAGLAVARDEVNGDLRRRQQGYGRSPRQSIETDEVEVLAGLRQGRTLGTPLALVVRNRDHKNWTWGMDPWPPEGEPQGKGTKAVTLPRPGHADLPGVMKYDHDDVRNALERASARHTAVFVAAGSVAKQLLRTIGIEVRGEALPEDGADAEAVDAARADRDTLGGVAEVRVTGAPPGLGSYATREDRLDARLAWALMAIQAVKAVEIGEGIALAHLRGSEAHDEIYRDEERGLYRETNRAGGLEGGMTNGEPLVVQAAIKPISTMTQPLRSVDTETKEPAQAMRERTDSTVVPAAAVVAEAMVALVLAGAYREKFGGDHIDDVLSSIAAYRERIGWRR
jgi:chorismate synthase